MSTKVEEDFPRLNNFLTGYETGETINQENMLLPFALFIKEMIVYCVCVSRAKSKLVQEATVERINSLNNKRHALENIADYDDFRKQD